MIRPPSAKRGQVALFLRMVQFFVWAKSVHTDGEQATFPLKAVQQLNPAIAAKMRFEGQSYKQCGNTTSETPTCPLRRILTFS